MTGVLTTARTIHIPPIACGSDRSSYNNMREKYLIINTIIFSEFPTLLCTNPSLLFGKYS